MKCFLFLLATGLVTSDKLDRTYLPPPGAQHSGGTLDDLNLPLEYPKETFAERNQYLPGYGLDKINAGFPTYQNLPTISANSNPSTTTPNNFNLKSSSPTLGNDFLTTTSSPYLNIYNSFPPKDQNFQYLPSKSSFLNTQSYMGPTSSSEFGKRPSFSNFKPNIDNEDKGYYYFVPAVPSYRNNLGSRINQKDYLPKNSYVQNQMNNDLLQNYQPNDFGYYGGYPMMMTSQNLLPQDNKLIPKLKESKIQIPVSLGNDQQENLKTLSTLPQTNAAQTKFIDKPNNSTILSNIPKQLEFSSSENKYFPKDKTLQAIPVEKNEIRLQSRLRPERPQAEQERNAYIINYENHISPEGYSYSYDTSNGIHADESAAAANGIRAKGSYSYTGDDGKVYTVTYTADENGFQPTGDHLPTPPPIPKAIQKVIEQAARDKAAGIVDDGSYDERKYGHLNYHHNFNQYFPSKSSQRKPLRLKNYKIALRNKNNFVNDSELQENKGEKKKNYDYKISANDSPQKNELNKRPIAPVTKKYENVDTITSSKLLKQQLDINNGVDKTNDENKPIKDIFPGQGSLPEGTYNDDGYFYVPPIIKFNPTNEPLKTTKITSFDDEQSRKNLKYVTKPTQLPLKQNINATESTRKPYISGPNDVDKDNFYETESNFSVGNNPNSLYEQNTTPVTTESINQGRQPIDINYTQYDQFSTNPFPNAIDQAVPYTENRVSTPNGKPGITVSQDFVTSTYSPPFFKDGVLEVNQNVKIYGIGKPTKTSTNPEYPQNVSGNTNNVLAIPVQHEDPTGFLYPDNFPGLNQDSGVFQVVPDTTIFFPGDNQPGLNFVNTNSPNYLNSEIENQVYQFQIPDIPYTGDTFGGPESTSGPVQTPVIPKNQSPNQEIVGEDFSGPKQPQKFDGSSGYFYK